MTTRSQTVYPIRDLFGSCLIFNIENFKNKAKDKRDGTNLDSSLIEETFSAIGYDVYVEHDPTAEQIKAKMKNGML